MERIALYVFCSSGFLVLYVLAGYPLALAVLSKIFNRQIAKRWAPKTVSIVVPVHNGEPWIRQKIESIADLDYPSDLIQVLFVNDGSTDRTAEVIRDAARPGLEVLDLPRGGKA